MVYLGPAPKHPLVEYLELTREWVSGTGTDEQIDRLDELWYRLSEAEKKLVDKEVEKLLGLTAE